MIDARLWIYQSSNGSCSSTPGERARITGSVLLCPDDGRREIRPDHLAPGVSATFWSLLSAGGVRGQTWGTSGDDPRMVGDYDGDGRDDFTIYRAGTGGNSSIYFILQSTSGTVRAELWGAGDDFPQSVPDYDGDGKTDLAVYRPSTGFFRKFSTTVSFDVDNWGTASDFEQALDYEGEAKPKRRFRHTRGSQEMGGVGLAPECGRSALRRGLLLRQHRNPHVAPHVGRFRRRRTHRCRGVETRNRQFGRVVGPTMERNRHHLRVGPERRPSPTDDVLEVACPRVRAKRSRQDASR